MSFSSSKPCKTFVLGIAAYFLIMVGSSSAQLRIVDGAQVRDAIVARLAAAGEQAAPKLLPQKQFYPCDVPLEVKPSFGSWRSVDVICTSPAKWKISVRAQVKGHEVNMPVKVSLPKSQAVYLKQPMRKGDRLKPDDVELRPIERLSSESVYDSLDQVVGRMLGQSLTPSIAVMPRHLMRELSVQEDDILSMHIIRGGIEIISSGVALEPGQLGDTIRVENLSSETVLVGRISGEKKVEIIAKGSR
ncbi:flagellar basal body P-ring formation chaperone FlgA [Planktotalea sp.]|uniref:flagellar basal body P-ring formation chaperone FlgA n=1 Tax=Planktotalea sp. TaxID=2029877 RepID=UPI003F6B3D2A